MSDVVGFRVLGWGAAAKFLHLKPQTDQAGEEREGRMEGKRTQKAKKKNKKIGD